MSEEKFLGYVYLITCNLNGKFYVGITNSPSKRWNKHVYDTKHNSPCVIHRAMRKYGLDNFSVSKIKQTSSKEELLELEQFYIKNLKSHVSMGGYNETFGGEAPMLGRKHTLESRRKMSLSQKGRPSPNKGKKASFATRKKLSDMRGKSVIQINLDGIVVKVFKSITEASKVVGIAGSNISGVCNGKKKTAGGYRWQYNEAL